MFTLESHLFASFQTFNFISMHISHMILQYELLTKNIAKEKCGTLRYSLSSRNLSGVHLLVSEIVP